MLSVSPYFAWETRHSASKHRITGPSPGMIRRLREERLAAFVPGNGPMGPISRHNAVRFGAARRAADDHRRRATIDTPRVHRVSRRYACTLCHPGRGTLLFSMIAAA